MAFNQITCPTSWILADGTSGTPDLRGIFIRGAGTSGILALANTSNGNFSATFGAYQNDSFQGHIADIVTSSSSYSSKAMGWDYIGGGTKKFAEGSGLNHGQYFLPKHDGTFSSDGTNGEPRKGDETRPASYGLIYCMKI